MEFPSVCYYNSINNMICDNIIGNQIKKRESEICKMHLDKSCVESEMAQYRALI